MAFSSRKTCCVVLFKVNSLVSYYLSDVEWNSHLLRDFVENTGSNNKTVCNREQK